MQFRSTQLLAMASILSSALAESSTYWTTLTPTATYPGGFTDYSSSFGIAIATITTDSSSSTLSSSSTSTATAESTSDAALQQSNDENPTSASVTGTAAPEASGSAEPGNSTYLEPPIGLVSCDTSGTLEMTLIDGILYDSEGRVGSIVANRQFQFDGPPPQAGAIYAKGWSITPEGNLAIGDNDVFYECLSGTFYNLYDQSIGGQCIAIHLPVVRLIDC